MSETLKHRVGRIMTGGLHAWLDRLEDQVPEAVMEQSIREAESVVDEVRHELGCVAARRHLAQQQHAHLNAQHSALSEQIETALTQSRDDLARAAVARQVDIEAQLPVLEATLADQLRQETELQSYVTAVLAKQREMRDALTRFRATRADASGSMSMMAAGGMGQGSGRSAQAIEQRMAAASDAFDRLHARQTGIAGTTTGASLSHAAQLRELENLVRDHKITERLAQLKAGRT